MAVFITPAAADDLKFDLMQREDELEQDGFQRQALNVRDAVESLTKAIDSATEAGVELDADLQVVAAEWGYCG